MKNIKFTKTPQDKLYINQLICCFFQRPKWW